MSQPCPSCGTESAGRFCSDCGAALRADCRACGAALVPGGRFCNQCGAAATAEPAAADSAGTSTESRRPVLPWAVAGVAIVALAAVLLPRLASSEAAPPAAAAAPVPAAMDPSSVDLASMSPRERADRLFNRVMEGTARGDTAQTVFFADMAVQAYGMVEERDADLHYHLAELHHLRGDAAAARAQADTILAADPGHLFGLFTAARAEALRGDGAAAGTFFRRFLDGYAAEVARDLPEYRDHAQGLPAMRGEAERALGER
jgi:hypothetical protein